MGCKDVKKGFKIQFLLKSSEREVFRTKPECLSFAIKFLAEKNLKKSSVKGKYRDGFISD